MIAKTRMAKAALRLPFDEAEEPPIRLVRLPGRVIEVRGYGAVTFWRDPKDVTSPFAGRWILASPDFRAQIDQATVEVAVVP